MESLEMKYRGGDVSEEVFRNAALEESLNILNAQNYQYIAKLGIGSFGCVYWMKDRSESRDLAAKIVLEDRVSASEVNIWPTLEHDNILPRVKACHLPDAKTFVFLTPKCSGTLDESLEDFEFMFSEKAFSTAVGWLKDVLTGLEYLHSEGYCHLDLKGNNVLIDGSRAVLSDFGFLAKTGEHVTEYGAPFVYRPPEATEGGPLAGKPFDVWTVGMLALEMFTQQGLIRTVSLTSANSFHQQIYPAILYLLEKKQFKASLQTAFQKSTLQKSMIGHIIHFIKGCLNLRPENRPDVKDLLSHKLFGGPGSMALTKTNVWNPLKSPLRLQLLLKKNSVPGGNTKQAKNKIDIVDHAQMFVLYYDRILSKEQDVVSNKQPTNIRQKTLAPIQKAENSFQDITNNSPVPDTILEPITNILETTVMQESTNNVQEAVTTEVPLNTIQEFAVTEDPVLVDETVITEDPIWVDETVITEDPVLVDETVITEDPILVDETMTTEDPILVDETVITEDPVLVDETVITKDPILVDETVITEDPVLVDETVITKDPILVDETMTTEDPILVDETVITEDPVLVDETVITEDPILVDETVITEDPILVDETVITENPVIIKATAQQPVNNISDTVHHAQNTSNPDFVTDFHKFEQCLENQSIFFLHSTIPDIKPTSRRLKIIRWLRRKKNRLVRILRACVSEMV